MQDEQRDVDRRTASLAAIRRALHFNERLRDRVAARLGELDAALGLVDTLRAMLDMSPLLCSSGRRTNKRSRNEGVCVLTCPSGADTVTPHPDRLAAGAACGAEEGDDAGEYLSHANDVNAATAAAASSRPPALVIGCTRRAVDVWGPVATSTLLDELRAHETPFLLPHNDAIWAEVAQRLRQYGFHRCTPLACYRQAQLLLVDRCAFTPKEDRLLCQFVAAHGRRWQALARHVYDTLQVRRSAFQLAQRYRDVMRATLFESRLTSATVWRRVERWAGEARGDHVRLTILANAARGPGELALQPLSVRQAMDHDVLHRLGSAALYWKIFAVLNRINIDYPERLEYFVARAALSYEQLTLASLAHQLHCTEDKLRARIDECLLQARRQLHLLNFDRLSVELFGHARCSRVIFLEACRLSKEDVVAGNAACAADARGVSHGYRCRLH